VNGSEPKASFSPWRKFGIALNVIVVIVAALAVVVALNYLSRQYFTRWQWSSRTRIQLAPRTVGLLHSLTNRVRVTLYYDKKEPLYSTIRALLDEYSRLNRNITVQTVDYLRDAALAQKVKLDYKLSLVTDKDLIIFDSEGNVRVLDGKALTRVITERTADDKFRRKPTEFEGEAGFTAALLAVTSAPMQVAYLQEHKEHPLDNGGEYGYLKFKALLAQNHLDVGLLSLLGTNTVPTNCDLLVIAAPRETVSDGELEKIDAYLTQGGRMLLLFNAASISSETHLDRTRLEKLLAKWGVRIGSQEVQDPDRFVTSRHDMLVRDFNQNHPVVNPLLGSALFMTMPRAVGKLSQAASAADTLHVEELAFTGPHAIAGPGSNPQRYPVVVAVEKGDIKDVITARGTTRMIVAGDSFFLANAWIDSAGNREFADYAVNWLINRPQLLTDIGPRPIKEYKIVMSNAQFVQVELMLLGGLPGSVLILGCLVWLRRRK
jgi:ABC-type uncharacterized transport system involved in gliding motility auxiliary subunit